MARGPSVDRGWLLVGALGVALVARPMACDGGPGARDPAVAKAIAATLADVWPAVLSPALAEAESAADRLRAAVGAWADAEAAGGDATAAQADAQAAWIEAMAAWQRVEPMQVGPLGSSLTDPGGRDLRDRIYAWPTVNRCAVDQVTAAGTFAEPGFADDALVDVVGLAALETLLWSPPGAHACDATFDETWAGLADPQAARAAYAVVLADGLRAAMGQTRADWEGGFGDAFAAGADPYDAPELALNALFDALFYLEITTKDAKLGEPLGLRDCGAATCPVESPLAGLSHRWPAENLAGGRALFTGGDGDGFDDLLRALGSGDVADEVLAAFDAADAVATLPAPIDDPDPTAALALHAALDTLGEALREDVATVLALQVPTEAAGDND